MDMLRLKLDEESFKFADKNKTGYVTPDEFRAVIEELDIAITKQEVKELLNAIDTNKNGVIGGFWGFFRRVAHNL